METVIDQTVSSEKKVDTRRVLIYLAFAFGIAWLAGLVVYLTGGMANSQELFPGTGITVVALLLPVAYMGAPAIAHVLTRLVTKEGWKNVGLRPNFRKGWPYWLMAWFGPAVLTIVGMIVYFLIFPQHYDPELGVVKALLAQSEAMTGVEVADHTLDADHYSGGAGCADRPVDQRPVHLWRGVWLAGLPAAQDDGPGPAQGHAVDGLDLGRVALAADCPGA